MQLDAEALEHVADLRAAAMHDDGVDRSLLHQHDIAGKTARRCFGAHGVAAVFHHDNFFVVLLHVRQRFDEDAGNVVGRHAHGTVLCRGRKVRRRQHL